MYHYFFLNENKFPVRTFFEPYSTSTIPISYKYGYYNLTSLVTPTDSTSNNSAFDKYGIRRFFNTYVYEGY